MAQHTPARWNWATFVARFALTGNHQDKAFIVVMRPQNKTHERRVRLVHGHTVKIKFAFGDNFTTPELTKGFSIHAHRLRGDGL